MAQTKYNTNNINNDKTEETGRVSRPVMVENCHFDSQGVASNRVDIWIAHGKAQSVDPIILTHSSTIPRKVLHHSEDSEEVDSFSSVMGEVLMEWGRVTRLYVKKDCIHRMEAG